MSSAGTSLRTAAVTLPGFRISLALAVLFIGAIAHAFNAWRWGTIPDTSWLITVAERVASGERLFVDVIELNPPFSIWLYMGPVRLAMLAGVAPESVVRVYTMLICLAGSALAGWMLASSGMLPRRRAAMVSVALFAVAVLLPGNSFSERDQIGAVLGLPLLVLAGWRALPGPKPSPRTLHWLAAGAGAGVLAMVKPYYAGIVIAASCLLALKRRDIRAFFMPEFLFSGAITAAYLGLSYALYPIFFETLLPLLRDTYMAFRQPADILLLAASPWIVLPVAYALLRRLIDRPEPSDFLMLAAAIALLPYFWQGKGWAYHTYTAILLGSAALVASLATLFEERSSRRDAGSRAGYVLAVLTAILVAHVRFAASEKPADSLVAAGLEAGENPAVGMLGGALEISHPLTRMIGGRWIEPYGSDWLATFAFRHQKASAAAGNRSEVQKFEAMEEAYFAGKKARLFDDPPQILIVHRKDGLTPRMLGKFGFQPLLDRYDRIAAADGVELYRLKAVPVALARETPPVAASD